MERRLVFTDKAEKDILFWKKSGNDVILKRIRNLLQSVLITPFEGIGKPEALKHDWAGYWSRRIDKEHRLVYKAEEDRIIIVQARYHY